jgi:adenosylmethionine-8-amino-7-oxononanoate transaminase
MNAHRLAALDQRYVWHPFTQMKDWLRSTPTVIVSGRGPYLRDAEGYRYLDANSSIWTNLHGHGHPKLNQAVARQLRKIAHSSALGLANEPASLLAEKLICLAPRSLKKVFYSDDGATAVEVALKMAFQYQSHRMKSHRRTTGTCLTLKSAYHGDTVGTMSLGDIDVFHRAYQPLMFRTRKVCAPYCYRCPFNRADPERADARLYRRCRWECISQVEKALVPGRTHPSPFAAIVEPLIQGAAGMIAHPRGYLKKFAALCRQRGVPLILDEVMTGFGRTGAMFACEQEEVAPDLLCVAKGITGGYLPLAATLTSQKVFDAFLGDFAEKKTFFHGHSYTANQLGCAAALANLEIFRKESVLRAIAARARALDGLLQRFWTLSHVGDIRRVGLIAAVELVRDWRTRQPYRWEERVGARICEVMRRHGVLSRPIGNVLLIMPPYCTTDDQLGQICNSMVKGIREVCG